MTAAILLAAGASSRMGRPKALLEVGGRTFVRRIVDTLRDGGAADLVVVVRPGTSPIDSEVTASGFGRLVVNPDPDRGQLSSLLVGLDAIERARVDGALVTLVDLPLVTPSTIAALLARATVSRAPILRATYRARHGHPVVFSRLVFPALRAAHLETGARPVLDAFEVDDVEVDDPGVLRDVDTPDDYARLAT